MEEYYFLYGLALIWIIAAIAQDLKKTEVANWLNFSLVGFALAYRAFYSASVGEMSFLAFGLLGFVFYRNIGNLMYYSGGFGGGDVKLLAGLGAVLPFNGDNFIFFSLGFILLLFISGLVYSLIYSSFIVIRRGNDFAREFNKRFRKDWYMFVFVLLLIGLLSIIGGFRIWYIILLIIPGLFSYLLAFDKIMVWKVKPGELQEGDWLIGDVRIGRKIIKKSVHGLSALDIKLLRKYRKGVLVKHGIPYTPSFLIAFLIMVFFLEVLLSFLGGVFLF